MIEFNNTGLWFSIGGLVVKLAVATPRRATSASPGFDSRPMHSFFLLFLRSFCRVFWPFFAFLRLHSDRWLMRRTASY
ncbi:uncharacterized protein K460DRAFT_30100 [Cucurbitaria berberidis CBS 394.84]|uniref:Uncharacterized protein n=1 Tax=Cucurbitaria berberidis CBS 394.84 TaxID=1168544 RepID=A0A9P4LEC1_9PLEO|nr:uncharacterized protein K460DRAFT_30100 [Cucurbitaria berberidis CBS 394.84]KAF1851227.1 hypothetical protein K460DRAFT_30100 [Cucurbitaria berberidis CBS 394.84]